MTTTRRSGVTRSRLRPIQRLPASNCGARRRHLRHCLGERHRLFARHFDLLGSFTSGNFLSDLSANDTKTLSGPQIFQQTDGGVVVNYIELFGPVDEDIRWHLANADFSRAPIMSRSRIPRSTSFWRIAPQGRAAGQR